MRRKDTGRVRRPQASLARAPSPMVARNGAATGGRARLPRPMNSDLTFLPAPGAAALSASLASFEPERMAESARAEG